jgi:hypothetical protein
VDPHSPASGGVGGKAVTIQTTSVLSSRLIRKSEYSRSIAGHVHAVEAL